MLLNSLEMYFPPELSLDLAWDAVCCSRFPSELDSKYIDD